jgi:hypothetical protein
MKNDSSFEFRVSVVLCLPFFGVLCDEFVHFNIHLMVVFAKGLLWLFVGKTKKRKKSDVN